MALDFETREADCWWNLRALQRTECADEECCGEPRESYMCPHDRRLQAGIARDLSQL